uniref:Uncharacterized protein n=1 Tax=Anguilla anguilla TaxID=7936 RepID=A0A0E9RSE0_ANGAN
MKHNIQINFFGLNSNNLINCCIVVNFVIPAVVYTLCGPITFLCRTGSLT